MNSLNSVEFQKYKSESKSTPMDSSFAKIKIPEIETGMSMESSAQNPYLINMENPENSGILTAGAKRSGPKFSWSCVAMVVVFVLGLTIWVTLLAKYAHRLGGSARNCTGAEAESAAIFADPNSNSKTANESFLPHSEPHQGQGQGQGQQEISNETSRGFHRLESQINNQHDDIRDMMTKTVGDLKGQMTTLHQNGSLEMISLRDELKQEISVLKDEIKSLLLNFNSNSSAPPNSTTAPALSAPRFYKDSNFKGAWFQPSSGWEKKCVNMPEYFDKVASSVKLEGHCLLICPGKGCDSQLVGPYPKYLKGCEEVDSNSYGLEDFTKIHFDNQISSFRLCQAKK